MPDTQLIKSTAARYHAAATSAIERGDMEKAAKFLAIATKIESRLRDLTEKPSRTIQKAHAATKQSGLSELWEMAKQRRSEPTDDDGGET